MARGNAIKMPIQAASATHRDRKPLAATELFGEALARGRGKSEMFVQTVTTCRKTPRAGPPPQTRCLPKIQAYGAVFGTSHFVIHDVECKTFELCTVEQFERGWGQVGRDGMAWSLTHNIRHVNFQTSNKSS